MDRETTAGRTIATGLKKGGVDMLSVPRFITGGRPYRKSDCHLSGIWIPVAIMVVMLLVSLFSTMAYGFDKKVGNMPDVTQHDFCFSFVKVATTGVASAIVPIMGEDQFAWERREGTYSLMGSGFMVANAPGYVWTAAHVVDPRKISVPYGRVSSYNTHVWEVVSRVITVYDYKDEPTIATIHYIDVEHDIAILKFATCPDGAGWSGLHPPSIPAWTGPLTHEVGDAIAIVVHNRDESNGLLYSVRVITGKINFEHVPAELDTRSIAYYSPDDFSFDPIISLGDSGSPVIVFQDGKPYIYGIARAMFLTEVKNPDGTRSYGAVAVPISPRVRYVCMALEKH